jgi:hypothetical protein
MTLYVIVVDDDTASQVDDDATHFTTSVIKPPNVLVVGDRCNNRHRRLGLYIARTFGRGLIDTGVSLRIILRKFYDRMLRQKASFNVLKFKQN